MPSGIYHRTLGAFAYAIGLGWLLVPRFGPEFLKAFIYDRLLSTLNPSLVEFGPSLAMAGLGSYLAAGSALVPPSAARSDAVAGST